jgi:hypothetical protein
MKKLLSFKNPFLFVAIFCVVAGCINTVNHTNTIIPKPVEGEENEKIREKYFELRHKTAPNVSWRAIEAENARQLFIKNQAHSPQG